MDVMKLPAAEDGPAAPSRRRAAPLEPGGEQRKRQKNACLVAALAEEDRSVKMLEDLVFGAEDELLARLAKVGRAGRNGALTLVSFKIK